MMKPTPQLWVLFLCYPFLLLHAQDFMVSGTVTDSETGTPLPNVNIMVKGTMNGTITSGEGTYQISIKSGQTLIYSSIGYLPQEVTLTNQNKIHVELVTNIHTLSEVIVTGYSTESRRQTTGAVATVETNDLAIMPTGNVEQMLQGRVAGVTVVSNGQPGTDSQVRVHGYGALRGPLYVVDGVPTENIDFLSPGDIASTTILKDASSASIYGSRASGGVIVITTKKGGNGEGIEITYDGLVGVTTPGNNQSLLNPQEQADWTWTAIRNTYKRLGATPVFNHPQYGSGSEPQLPDWLLVGSRSGIRGDLDLEEEALKYNNDSRMGTLYLVVPSNLSGTDWYDAMTQNGFTQRHHIGLTSSSDGNILYLGLSAQEQEGTILYNRFQRFSLRINSQFEILPNLRIGENFQATYRATRNLRGLRINQTTGGLRSAELISDITVANITSPIIPVYDQFGGFGGDAASGVDGFNPVSDLIRSKNNGNFGTRLFGNIYLEFEPVKNLMVRTSYGGEYSSHELTYHFHRTYERASNNPNHIYLQHNDYHTQWVWTNTLNYTRGIGSSHTISMLLGHEALNTGTFRNLSGRGINPFLETVDYTSLNTVASRRVSGSHSNGVNFASYFTSLSYDFDDKYQANIILRRDGSSRFATDVRWGTFPAFSLGWRISQEAFMPDWSFIEDVRLRLGYGQRGNSNNVDPNNQFDLYSTSRVLADYDISGTNNSVVDGFYRTRIGNPSGKWETSISKNIGLDAIFFRGKYVLSADFWREDTKNLLLNVPITTQAGANIALPFRNVGGMRNQGLDVAITGYGNLSTKLQYEFTVTGSFLENKITTLGPGLESIPWFSSNYFGITPILNQVGSPLSSFYGYKVQGLFQNQQEIDKAASQLDAAPGRFRYLDVNHDGTINTEDKVMLGSPIADFTGGFSLSLNLKRYELQLYGYASIGNEIYNMSKIFTDFYLTPMGTDGAKSQRVQNSWSEENSNSDIPMFENAFNFSTSGQASSFFVENGSFFRLQNISFSYYFHPSMLARFGFKNFRITTSVNNLFTISGYDGLDPSISGQQDQNFGIDLGNYPINRSYTLGISIAF